MCPLYPHKDVTCENVTQQESENSFVLTVLKVIKNIYLVKTYNPI